MTLTALRDITLFTAIIQYLNSFYLSLTVLRLCLRVCVCFSVVLCVLVVWCFVLFSYSFLLFCVLWSLVSFAYNFFWYHFIRPSGGCAHASTRQTK